MDASNDIQYSIGYYGNKCEPMFYYYFKSSRTKNVNVHLLRLYGNISRKYTKSIFNKETLQEIHMSFQSVYSKQFDLHNYVHKIDFFGNRLALIGILNGVKDLIDYYQRSYFSNDSQAINWNTAQGQKLDERHLKIIEIQDFFAVPYTKQDKSKVKRQLLAINRKEKRNQKNKEDKNSLKRKYGQSKIQSIDENIYEFESDNSQSKKVDIEEIRLRLELEIEDRKMNLKET
ncbi:unnamed protein product [Rhizophagus irregularis]|nr:unnamed protein product [Rhizophagus irregularis]